MKKKLILTITSLLVAVSTFLFGCSGIGIGEVLCSGVNCFAYNIDCAGREIVACGLEGVACINEQCSCISPYACICGKENYETVFVACPLACSNEARNCNGETSCSSCMIHENIDTVLDNEDFTYDYKVEYDRVNFAESYYKANITIELKTYTDWAYVVCDLSVVDDDGNRADKEIYVGNMFAGKSKKITASFTFYGKKANVKISQLSLAGGYPD